jgi:hypothetical protein
MANRQMQPMMNMHNSFPPSIPGAMANKSEMPMNTNSMAYMMNNQNKMGYQGGMPEMQKFPQNNQQPSNQMPNSGMPYMMGMQGMFPNVNGMGSMPNMQHMQGMPNMQAMNRMQPNMQNFNQMPR